MRKRTFCHVAQRRLKSACVSARSDQSPVAYTEQNYFYAYTEKNLPSIAIKVGASLKGKNFLRGWGGGGRAGASLKGKNLHRGGGGGGRGLLLKERIYSQWEQILSFKSSP